MSSELYTSPKGWKWVKLGDTGKVISGGTPSTKVPEYWNGKINWISPADLTGNKHKTIIRGVKSITEAGLTKSSARLMPKGSVLFSSRAPIGYVAIAGDELCTNQGFKSIIPNTNVDSEFLYYSLKGIKRKAEEVASGTTFKEISLTQFSELIIPLPPLPIQKAIVSKIEELFSELDKAIEQLKTAQQQLKTYRQAVLKWAFEGRLTNEDIKEGELPEGWFWCKNEDLLEYVTSGSRDWKQYYSDHGARFIRTQDINTNQLDISSSAFVNLPKKVEGKRSLVEKGDLLMTITGANVGKVAIIDFDIPETYVSQSVALLKYQDKRIVKYLWYYFQTTNFGKTFIERLVYGVGRPVLSLKNMREVAVLMCPINDQSRIIQKIESRLSVADKLDEIINNSLQQAEALRQSILKKAFEGKLH